MKRMKVLLVISLVLCLLSGIGAHVLQTDFGNVQVEEVKIPGSDGSVISGLLYRPKSATADHPLPLIITAHGSYNNKEMQDQNLIELSRRGFIVFAGDSYRHGNSSIHVSDMSEYTSLVDIVEALYDLNYVDQEKVALTGHSMGADQTNNTVKYYLTQEALGEGENKIAAALVIGCDPPYTSYEVEDLEGSVPVNIDYGVIEAKYDEWFFKQEDVGMDPARYLESANAKAFIEQVGVTVGDVVENGKVYEGTVDGKDCVRVIYQNPEIHPMNHFSSKTAASTVDFFYTVFGVPDGYGQIDTNDQVWFFKELFNLIGLVGVFMLLLPLSDMLLHTRFFKEVISDRKDICVQDLSSIGSKVGFWVVFAIDAAIPALLLMPVGFKWIGKESFVPSTFNKLFGEPNTNELVGWSVAVALAILAVNLLYLVLRKRTADVKTWGVSVTARQFFKSLLLALLTVTGAYLVVFAVNYIFNTDFRIWVLAVKTFDLRKLLYALVYFPGFAVFYLINSLITNNCNHVKGWKEWQILLVSCIGNIAGMVVLIAIQYAALIDDGTITFNAMRIVNLFPLLVLIPVATILSRQYFKKTKNIYTGSLVFGMFYAMVTCANTAFLGSLI